MRQKLFRLFICLAIAAQCLGAGSGAAAAALEPQVCPMKAMQAAAPGCESPKPALSAPEPASGCCCGRAAPCCLESSPAAPVMYSVLNSSMRPVQLSFSGMLQPQAMAAGAWAELETFRAPEAREGPLYLKTLSLLI